MTKQFWAGLIVGVAVSGIAGGLIGVSMVGKKATVAPSDWEAFVVNKLKTLKIPEAPSPATPIEMSEENVFEGGEHYNGHCAVCHDLDGGGDSKFAKAFNPPVADLTSEEVQRYSDGQLKWIVDNGIRFTGMPGWDDQIEDDTQWKIVYYMRALADPEKAEMYEAGLKARGSWKIGSPAGGGHHGGEAGAHEQAHSESAH